MLPIVHLNGPTASGKSALAERLCEHFDVELISVDSVLVYRGLDIGSAKPDQATRQRCRYHLIDLLEPEATYSAAQFVSDAQRLIAEIHARSRIPVLVGGTHLYFRALTQGLSDVPTSDPAVHAALITELAEHGLPALHTQLSQVDPLAATRIHAHDSQRTLRALAVFRQTGRPLSSQQGVWETRRSVPANELRFVVYPQRAWLHERIARRFQEMLDADFLSEVRTLMQRQGLTLAHTAMRAVGYRQAWQHLLGEFSHAELLERGIAATRQLAKRQITWSRSDLDSTRLEGDEAQNFETLCHALSAFTANPARL
jgi:tRNA dimethylallyltransferase